MILFRIAFLSQTICLPLLAANPPANDPSVIPLPLQITATDGAFHFDAKTSIHASPGLENETKRLREWLSPATGFALSQSATADAAQIQLILDPSIKDLGAEGYEMHISAGHISIRSEKPAGVFYGIQSLVQLLPPPIVTKQKQDAVWSIPAMTIRDRPRFPWRAFMLDESRYFKGSAEVKKLLDQMAALKMNTFHWHLTDDQGWRIEIKKYPLLTEVGSKRKDSQIGGWDSAKRSGEPHGGFYTQSEIREIVAYALDRHITIVPEIGMPGHASAAIAAYPWLGTKQDRIEVPVTFGKHEPTYHPASERVYQAISEILDEVVALFPGPVIHIGGDEVKFNEWRQSDEVRELMKRENLATMADVQIYFTNRVAKIVGSKKRNAMGWNEILGDDLHGFLEGGQTAKSTSLDPETIIHFWKGDTALAKRAIHAGHRIVNSLHSETYLDYNYGGLPLSRAYRFDPVIPGLTPEEEKQIIGTGCQMWGEWIPTVERMEKQVYPRLAAYAEVGWTMRDRKDEASFLKRLRSQLARWDLQNIGHAREQSAMFQASDFFNFVTIDKWSPERVPSAFMPVDFSTAGKIIRPGTYEFAWVYQSGAHALEIHELSLMDGDRILATNRRKAFSGARMQDVVFTLEVPELPANAKLTLRAHIRGSEGTDSHGELRINGPL